MPKENGDKELVLTTERKLLMKKRVKKLKSRMMSRGNEYETSLAQNEKNEKPINSQNKPKYFKN
jgi:hypothetical protein